MAHDSRSVSGLAATLKMNQGSGALGCVELGVLPTDIQERVIVGLPYENVCPLNAVSKPSSDCIEPFNYLTAVCKPDLDLFKEFLVCTKDGIICVNVSKTAEDRLIVFNSLTRKWKELPPLNHRRNPVLIMVGASTHSYQVIVAGSSWSGDDRLSRMTEAFDPRTWKRESTGDLPGPYYALDDYQSGVYKDGSLYCIAFLDQEAGKGILRYNLSKGVWSQNWTYPIPFSTNSTILQLVECWGEIYPFSEQENENSVEHCIDRVEWDIDIEQGVSWSLYVRRKTGGRGLLVYPEYTCVPYSEHQLCVFNTIDHSRAVYDVWNHGQSEVLQAPPSDQGFSGDGFNTIDHSGVVYDVWNHGQSEVLQAPLSEARFRIT